MKTKESEFEIVSPESVGITSASVLNLLDELEHRKINLHSLMILRHGRSAVNLWWKPYSQDIPHQLYSFSKSIVSAAAGLAVDEGLLDTDEYIASFFPRRIKQDADERIFSVTVEHLLTMTSGAVAQNETGTGGQTDWVEWFLNTPLNYEPGERFIYNSLNTYMLAAILRQVTGEGLVDYLMPRLFEPLGIERPVWDKCPMGIECGGWGLYLRTEDMAKFCQLCLNDGVWRGRRILPEGWAAKAGESRVTGPADSKLNDSPHRTSGYGRQFWRNGDGTSWRADGMFGQYGLIIPEKDMVIITTGGHARQMEVLDALYDAFMPCIDAIPEGSEAGEDYAELLERGNELSLQRRSGALPFADRNMEAAYDFPMNRRSIIPLAIKYLHRTATLGVRRVGFAIDGEDGMLAWTEDGRTQTIPFRTDGSFCQCRLNFGSHCYPAVTSAAWLAEDKLEIDVRYICTAHMQKLLFTFEDDEIVCTFDEDPSLEDMLCMLFELSPQIRPMAERLARLVNRIMPSVRGRRAAELLQKQ